MQRTRGILLQVIPYLGHQRIYRIFTEDSGLITLMSKKDLLSPFCIAEWVYRKKTSEIFTLIEGSLIDGLLELRTSYAAVHAAGKIAQDLLRTQLPGKSAPALYHLASGFMKKMILFQNPSILVAGFRLKLLLHEGLLALTTQCAHCNENPIAILEGESVCLKHFPFSAAVFSMQEWEALHLLTFSRKFSLLEGIDFSCALEEKIEALFEERTR